MSLRLSYKHTLVACYIGYVIQAIVNNFAPLLFVTFQSSYGISLDKIALLVFLNFGVQLIVDLLSARFLEKIGYRLGLIISHACCFLGLLMLSFLPAALPNHPFAGLIAAVVVYAVGGGLLEVLISPVVEAAPTENKSAHMSLLHSFYCWGHVFVVLSSTLFFTVFGIEHWRILALIWALFPLFNGIYFCLVPLWVLNEEEGGSMPVRQLFSTKLFWVLALLMLCAGAAEQAMSQWASAFAESGLNVSKTVGDLAGPCMFAVCMGTSRTLYAALSEKIDLKVFMQLSCLLSIVSFLLASLSENPILALIGCALCGLSVGIMWPGTYSIAAKCCPGGGTALFALLALAGDTGCSSGPALVGLVTSLRGGRLQSGLLLAVIYPIVMLLTLFFVKKSPNSKK